MPFMDSNMSAQSTEAVSNATEDTEVEKSNLSSSESDNDSSSSGNESSKNSTPGFSLLGGLTCLYGVWKFRKK